MKEPTTIRLPLQEVKVDYSINGRDDPHSVDSSYNIPALKAQVMDAKRIITAPGIEKMRDGTYRVLDGFRRMTVANMLFIDPETPNDVRDNLREMDFRVYEDLSDDERNQILFNHGTQSPLTRVETIKQIWRSYAAGMSYNLIYQRLFSVLLSLSSKKEQEKLKGDLESLTTDKEKNARLTKFFKGKIGDYFLDGYLLGERVQKSIIETEAGRMPKGGKEMDGVQLFKTSQPRIVALSAAKRRDTSKDGKDGKGNQIEKWDAEKDGKGWNPKDGGIRFNERIEAFIVEDKGGGNGDAEKVLTKDELTQRRDNALSKATKLAFTLAKGEPLPEGSDLLAIDANANALEDIQAVILTNLETLRQHHSELYPVFAALAVPDGSGKKFAEEFAKLLNPNHENGKVKGKAKTHKV